MPHLHLSNPQDDIVFRSVLAVLKGWSDASQPEVAAVDEDSLRAMYKSGELPTERAMRRADAVARGARAFLGGLKTGASSFSGLFAPAKLIPPPPLGSRPTLPAGPVQPSQPPRLKGAASSGSKKVPSGGGRAIETQAPVVHSSDITPLHDALIIVVNPRNKTEIYLAKRVLLEDPAFFGWPFLGQTQPKRAGNPGQPQPDPPPTAEVLVYNQDGTILDRVEDDSLKLWTYSVGKSANDDFRMTLVGGVQNWFLTAAL